MKFKQYIEEEYMGSFDAGKGYNRFSLGYTEVFKNPSIKEMKSVLETSPWWNHIKTSLRFICDFKSENLYVFKPTTYHSNVAEFLVKEKMLLNDRPNSNIFWGEASLIGGHLDFLGSDSGPREGLIKKFRDKDKWTERWFQPSLINSIVAKGME